jgi:hypothetical protein
MRNLPMHNLRRISPKGEEFIGICQQCGLKMSMKDAMKSWCDNPIGASQERAVKTAIEGKTQ